LNLLPLEFFFENAMSVLGVLDTLYLDALLVLGLFEQFATLSIYNMSMHFTFLRTLMISLIHLACIWL